MKTRLIKTDIVVKTDEDIMRVLLDGYVVKEIDTNTENTIKLVNGMLGPNPGVTYEVYKEEQVPWYENIPEQGILCWVSNIDATSKIHVSDIRLKDSTRGFCAFSGTWWNYATPVTLEEVKQYILEE